MSKKIKNENEKNETVKETRTKLTPGEYWEWRCTIEEMKTANLHDEMNKLKRDLMEREIENRKLRLMLFKDVLKVGSTAREKSKAEYERFKKKLEDDLGISFNNSVIDDLTFEVKSLD